jgi:hypothetical protein
MTTLQLAVITDQLPVLAECAEQADVETWADEWDGPEVTSRTVADRDFGIDPTWPGLPALSMAVSYVLLLLLGALGAHQFYLRNWWRGGLYLITAGGLGVGLAIDVFTLPRQLEKTNTLRALGLR